MSIIGTVQTNYKGQRVTVEIPVEYIYNPYNINIPIQYIINKPDDEWAFINISEMVQDCNTKCIYETVSISSDIVSKILLDYFNNNVYEKAKQKMPEEKKGDLFGAWVCCKLGKNIKNWNKKMWKDKILWMWINNEIN